MNVRRFLRNWAVGSAAVVAVSLAAQSASGAGPALRHVFQQVPGGQGTDTSLPLTESAVTVSGRGRFADLRVTVNQTQSLGNQAVSITWTGAAPTRSGASAFASDYLQIMQCWGDPVEAADGTAGPPPEQCVFGATTAQYDTLSGNSYPDGNASTRRLSSDGWENFDAADGYYDVREGQLWSPFRPVRGNVVNNPINAGYDPSRGGNYWLNPFFDMFTTNEIAGARTAPDGTGAELFQVETGVQSAGLGCGQQSQAVEGGTKVPQCWIVVVPRGDGPTENAGTPLGVDSVKTSPLAPAAWANRIAIPLGFNSVDPPCPLGADERRISGNELPLGAISRWQSVLCGSLGLPPFSYAPVGDPTARQQVSSGAAGAPGMIVVSEPIAAEQVAADNPVVYAPLTLSGITIGFNVERLAVDAAPEQEELLQGTRVANINLTPRLVAKLLTQSYRTSLYFGNLPPPEYAWIQENPHGLLQDEDFLRFNPEFRWLQAGGRTLAGLQVPVGNSDAARMIWEWILADPEAKAWLDGAPDAWGMRVNPYYSTSAEVNPTGAPFGEPLPNGFPKDDPFCYQAPPTASVLPPPLCGVDHLPYTRSFSDSASITRRGADGARVVVNSGATSPAEFWKREPPQDIGRRAYLAVTDTVSAARYGIQTAALSRAGDNGDDRQFVEPDGATMVAAVAAMPASEDAPEMLVPDPAHTPAGAYPLTIMSYAGVAPLALDPDERADYAAFIRYAVTHGQTPGADPGQLPDGYAPLPETLRSSALAVADLVQSARGVPEFTSPTAPTTSAVPLAAEVPAPERGRPGAGPAPAPVTATTGAPPSEPSSGGSSSGRGPTSSGTNNPSGRASTTTAPATSTSPAASPAASSVPDSAITVPIGDEPPATAEVAPALTPLMSIGSSRYAVPALGVVGLGSALGALEITKRPRRALAGQPGAVTEEP